MTTAELQRELAHILGAPVLVLPPKWEGQTVAIVKLVLVQPQGSQPQVSYEVHIDVTSDSQVHALLKDLTQVGGL